MALIKMSENVYFYLVMTVFMYYVPSGVPQYNLSTLARLFATCCFIFTLDLLIL